MKLILTEKPSVANDIAEALGKFKKCDGYNIVGEYHITYAIGHLLQQNEKDIPKNWTLDTLPIFPEFFSYIPLEDKIKQFKIIEGLLNQADELIIATDAGREGELIARLILYNAGWKDLSKNSYRLWTSEALTPFVVKRELENLKPAIDFDSLYYSALARQHSDYITGVNLTRLVSIKANGTWSVGRVQTPTLNLIVIRDLERINFSPEEYFLINGIFEKDKIKFSGKLLKNKKLFNEDNFNNKLTKEESENFLLDLQIYNYTTGFVKKIDIIDNKTAPPLLHSLTSLQREANRIFGFSAQQTFDIAQVLYEKYKCISYPRTDSNHLADTKDMKLFIKDKLVSFDYSNLSEAVEKASKRVFDSSKLTDHHALIPLAAYSGKDALEKIIFDLIHKRFIGAFMKDYYYQKIKAIIVVAGYHFQVTGEKDLNLGWKILYEEEQKKNEVLPMLQEKDIVKVVSIKQEQKFTMAPDLINEDTLLGMMEKLNLGTPATRANIIETLLRRDFLYREKTYLISTDKGKELIHLLADSDIISPEMTAVWENKLEGIYKKNKGFAGYQLFYEDIKKFIVEQIKNIIDTEFREIKQVSVKQRELAKELMKGNKIKIDINNEKEVNKFISDSLKQNQEGLPCLCGNGKIIKTPKCYKCTCEKEKIVWNSFLGKNISWGEAVNLIAGNTVNLKGLQGKNGKFDTLAKLEEKGKLTFVNSK